MMEMVRKFDHIVLFSGDGDFRRLIEAVQRKGVGVSFRGSADVERANISGTVEGSVTVRELLTVRASARILSGSTSYGELEIERGGTVTGTVRPLPEDAE